MSFHDFHDSTRNWFEKNLGTPTEAQVQAWDSIKKGKHTLISAPTGSGKTLAAFYVAIDGLINKYLSDNLYEYTQVVYVSPLKALSNDIHRNLEVPLSGINEELTALGIPPAGINIAVRTGDTSQGERRQMLLSPPHILITTPESLYLLLTSAKGRIMLSAVRTIIIDEIHSLFGSKRGSHLALSVERLEVLTGFPLQRIGLSATQKPIEKVSKYLVGNSNIKNGISECSVIDINRMRNLDLSIEIPRSPLTAVMSNEVWGELYERLVELINQHSTTLIFVNTRRLAERLALALSERIGEENVSSHHGSMSREHRLGAEQRLKKGNLKALVATASMELGIDIGSVDLVIQFSSPKSISTLLQRIGRSRHHVGGLPKGIIFPLSRDDLVECTALIRSVKSGELDETIMPEKPLDVLAQQIVAEVSGQEWNYENLYKLFRNAYPYRYLSTDEFGGIVNMLAKGYSNRRGRKSAHIQHDVVNSVLRARRGTRLNALTNGGAIPDMFDYEVVLHPEGITIGSVNEDFALESTPGDIFTLGTHSWQLLRVEGLKIIVKDATGLPPTVPFWFGEGPGRTIELSRSLSYLRDIISDKLDEDPLPSITDNGFMEISCSRAVRWLVEETGLSESAAGQLVLYLWTGKKGLGVVPSQDKIIIERFFDEAGDMHIVIHSLYGSHMNKAWGLALRKKFCRRFNFELQAAANEDSIILSLSSSHSFPLDEVFSYLSTDTVRETLIQAMLDSPMFDVRWRWNATTALAIQRNRGGKRVPPQLQRMQAEDLVAQVFPDQIACFENIDGEREIPDHPLVKQTVHDCLTDAMDVGLLTDLIGKIQNKEVELITKDLREPSPFAREIINARPYAFLDDTEFFQRRVNAIRNRSWLDPGEASDLSRLDSGAIERVKNEAWPQARSVDELQDVLGIYGFITEDEAVENDWNDLLIPLKDQSRASALIINCKNDGRGNKILWIATEKVPQFRSIFPVAGSDPHSDLPEILAREKWPPEEAIKEIIRGRLEALGPVTTEKIAGDMGIPESGVSYAMLTLEAEGFVFRGRFTPGADKEEWCERRLLQRIHKYSIESLRDSIEPVSVQDYMKFLFIHHGISNPEQQRTGPESLQSVLEQLEGYASPAASWETDIIPLRMSEYDPVWLDALCTSGKLTWGRFNQPKQTGSNGKKTGPVKSTPICISSRQNLRIWQIMAENNNKLPRLTGSAHIVKESIEKNGASFFDDLVRNTGLIKSQIEDGLAELVAGGLVSCDTFSGLRALLTPSYNRPSVNGRRKRRTAVYGMEDAGRWSLIHDQHHSSDKQPDHDMLEKIAMIYIRRWGIVFRSILERETFAPPWRILVRILRRLELRGVLRGGMFVSGVSGEQFALPQTVDLLRKIKKRVKSGELISISAADPLNLIGLILPGKKLANITNNRILFEDGIPVAVLDGKEARFLKDLPENEQWELRKKLILRVFPPKLRAYLGINYR